MRTSRFLLSRTKNLSLIFFLALSLSHTGDKAKKYNFSTRKASKVVNIT